MCIKNMVIKIIFLYISIKLVIFQLVREGTHILFYKIIFTNFLTFSNSKNHDTTIVKQSLKFVCILDISYITLEH